ncbi:chemotaxis protein CheB [Novosphingobium album (ex Liu et al. 2023)]|uniref:protein-glutamate methylesterase n=1 Tax=Novosphingobium album (ex Liu et al. 2023) TaxID=3031130 RepID=A0ABT5WX01_9SPHN|nr:chemotaxis protein CheB [Novosphingobium album (ex Liu et al. 2023)]MDE8654432.1 chemotaxis protein CheB [Novosphingobium album (ex Liu et al. 2023)]
MHDARVLVVDDSAAMRALFCDVLEQSRNVRVVGTAANAAEARDQIAEVMPNVLTLDVEMPGMSGIDFLEEIMTSNPLPVVMLSSLTQSGTETSLKAFELGAVECFPKPLKATPEQFAKTVGKLGKIVLAAANSNVRDKPRAKVVRAENVDSFQCNGTIAAFSASMGGVDALSEVFAQFPANCPPTVIVLQTEPAVAQAFIARANKDYACTVKEAADGAALTPGTVHIASDPGKHVVVEPGDPAVLRLVERDPVEGFRPSATLLFGSIARGGRPAIGAVLTGMGEDGAKGLKLLRDAGCRTLAQDRNSATVPQAPAAAVAAGAVDAELKLEDLATAVLSACAAN